jgi:hypothetical protein
VTLLLDFFYSFSIVNIGFDGKKKSRHCKYDNLLLTYSPFYHFRLIFNKKFGQEFIHFSSAWSSKMNDKTKLKDLKFKNEILFESKMRGKNKIKG